MKNTFAVIKTEQDLQITAPVFGKKDVRKLLDIIAGEGNDLQIWQFDQWHDLIMYAIRCMRFHYENEHVDEGYPIRVYYASCWQKIDSAGNDKKLLLEAVEDLRSMIQWE